MSMLRHSLLSDLIKTEPEPEDKSMGIDGGTNNMCQG